MLMERGDNWEIPTSQYRLYHWLCLCHSYMQDTNWKDESWSLVCSEVLNANSTSQSTHHSTYTFHRSIRYHCAVRHCCIHIMCLGNSSASVDPSQHLQSATYCNLYLCLCGDVTAHRPWHLGTQMVSAVTHLLIFFFFSYNVLNVTLLFNLSILTLSVFAIWTNVVL